MTDQDKKNKIKSISIQVSSLKESVDNANIEINEYLKKRDSLNSETKKLQQAIDELRNQRNSMNQKVKILKQTRDEASTKIKAFIEEIQLHNHKLAELKKKISRESREKLQREFDDIEWKIQTTPLEIQEEKRLIERVKQLETKLRVYKKFDQHLKKITKLRNEIESFQTSVEATHKELTQIAEKSQKIHEKMMIKLAEHKAMKKEADSFHRAYIKEIKKIKPVIDEIRKLAEQKRKLKIALQKKEEEKKKNVEQTLKKKLGSKAKDKLQRGEKLSWDEFTLLADEESADQQTKN